MFMYYEISSYNGNKSAMFSTCMFLCSTISILYFLHPRRPRPLESLLSPLLLPSHPTIWFLKKLFYVCECFAFIVCTSCMPGYRWLWASKYVLGTEAGSSAKKGTASALNTEPSLQPLPHPLLISMDYPSWIVYTRHHVLWFLCLVSSS